MQEFYMLIGLPGSGKSTEAENIIKYKYANNENCHIHSSDAIRKELYGSEECQDNPSKIFDEMFNRTITSLNDGYSVVYDATNINRKRRIELLDKLSREYKEPLRKRAVLVYANINECYLRNRGRNRQVPDEVILKMLMNFELPVKGEGWDDVNVVYNTPCLCNYDTAIDYFVGPLAHENKHHNLDVDLHMYSALDYFTVKYEAHSYPEYLRYAIAFHDIGKRVCKTHINKKGERTEDAHYYQHANVGAYLSLSIAFNDFQGYNIDGTVTTKFTDEDKYNMAVLINYHMRALEAWKESEKSKNKDKKILGDEMFNYLEIVNDCDEQSEEDNEWVATFLGTHLPDTYRKYGLNWHKYTNPLKEIDFSYD